MYTRDAYMHMCIQFSRHGIDKVFRQSRHGLAMESGFKKMEAADHLEAGTVKVGM